MMLFTLALYQDNLKNRCVIDRISRTVRLTGHLGMILGMLLMWCVSLYATKGPYPETVPKGVRSGTR